MLYCKLFLNEDKRGKKLYNYVFNEFNWIEILIMCVIF